DELIDNCDAAGTALRIIDVAPELHGAVDLIAHAVSRGVVVSLAHTDATYEQAIAGIDAGATLATHLFNAMRPVHHREPGVVTAALTDDRVTCELILDGHHVHPAVVSMAHRCAGAPRNAAISDASPVAGLGDGVHTWGGMTVNSHNGELTDNAGRLAGAGCLLDTAAATLYRAGASVTATLLALSVTPLRVLDPSRSSGLQVGDQIWCPGTCVTLPAG
ncbi:MAG: N-acetylglucosamine-6-phosphate deacetylase, partial [Thermoleophilia bacterium]|nr:N-acetylglucosamine-6-phosphate deacetylase [Thermoleophilia bacterium]